ncbi:lactate utilization protein C [Hansschlegelia beijingensis]|uniref:LutC/YkgG family protein n=1 Tax=Hansschlegelia beijingensis TaxID=1133344 RepID=UPI00387F0CE8
MTPREQIFANIRRSLGSTGEEKPRRMIVEERLALRPAGVLPARAAGKSARERVALFVEMAEASAATVSTVKTPEQAPAAIAEFLRAHNLAPALRRGTDPRLEALPWDRTTLDVTTGRTFGDDAAGVSAAFGAVAETGTLVLVSGEDNPTTLNFLPDNHIVVLDVADVAATYEDVWGRVRDRFGAGVMPRTVNWITGPSRSADIEQILLMGAHGPRRLHIVLIDPEAAATESVPESAAAPAGSTPAEPRVGSTLAADPKKPGESEPASPAKQPEPEDDEEDEDELDEAIEESFPASDPPSQTQP